MHQRETDMHWLKSGSCSCAEASSDHVWSVVDGVLSRNRPCSFPLWIRPVSGGHLALPPIGATAPATISVWTEGTGTVAAAAETSLDCLWLPPAALHWRCLKQPAFHCGFLYILSPTLGCLLLRDGRPFSCPSPICTWLEWNQCSSHLMTQSSLCVFGASWFWLLPESRFAPSYAALVANDWTSLFFSFFIHKLKAITPSFQGWHR